MVGEKIADQSRALDLEDGVLTLQADHPAWRQEITVLIPQIIARYNERFGTDTVRQIQWDRRLPRKRRGDN